MIKEKKELLTTLSPKEIELNKIIFELQDRKLLSLHIEEIKTIINNRKLVFALVNHQSLFNTYSISKKTTAARDSLIKFNFEKRFQEELKLLRKSHISIEFNFGTNKGTSVISNKIGNHCLLDILSEGEQKTISLAEFLTELQLDNNIAPVVFDDPVNSLDHKIIDDVANRLLLLSEERQVVILTHSVLLFNSLLHLKSLPQFHSLKCNFFNATANYGKTGIIELLDEPKNSVGHLIGSMKKLVNDSPNGRSESDVASDGYSSLRSAIELCVEYDIFQGTVKRYQKNIALTLFLKVNGNLITQYKTEINSIFERCCSFTKAHSNPESIDNQPSMEDFRQDLEHFIAIRKQFTDSK